MDDYIRVDISNGDSPIKDLTIAAWVKPTTLSRPVGNDGYFFSYMSSSSNLDNLLLVGLDESGCIRFYVADTSLKSSSCSSHNIVDGKYVSRPSNVCLASQFSCLCNTAYLLCSRYFCPGIIIVKVFLLSRSVDSLHGNMGKCNGGN